MPFHPRRISPKQYAHKLCISRGRPHAGHAVISTERSALTPAYVHLLNFMDSLSLSFNPLFALLIRFLEWDVFFFGAANTQGGKSSSKDSRLGRSLDQDATATSGLGTNARVDTENCSRRSSDGLADARAAILNDVLITRGPNSGSFVFRHFNARGSGCRAC